MATRRKSATEDELMTPANISKVIRLLEPEEGVKPITKKDACAMLGMSYNTTRLGSIIEDFKKTLKPDEIATSVKDFNPKKTKLIDGDADFRNTQVINLSQLTTIGGHADFRDSQVTDLGQLTTIGGYADFEDSEITDLGNLQSIGGWANFRNTQITDLGKLEYIGEIIYFGNREDLKKQWEEKEKYNNFSTGGEINNTNVIAQIWEWFGIKF